MDCGSGSPIAAATDASREKITSSLSSPGISELANRSPEGARAFSAGLDQYLGDLPSLSAVQRASGGPTGTP